MKWFTPLLLCLTLAMPVYAQDAPVPLEIDGDTVLVVKTLPFKVRAEKNWEYYDWNYPANVTVSKNDDVLTVVEAPAGEYTFSVVMMTTDITVEKDTLKVTKTKRKKFGIVKVIVGNVPPAPGPGPVAPTDPLVVALQEAYNGDASDKKAEYLKFMGNFFAAGDALVDASPTVDNLFTRVTTGLRAPGVGIPKPDFDAVVRAAAKHITANVGISGTLDKVKAKKALSDLSKALKSVSTAKAHTHKTLEVK